jgi:hypothetical protein
MLDSGAAVRLLARGGGMATERLSMHKTREILRQKWALGRSHREVARSLGVSFGAVATVMSRAKLAGLESFEEAEWLGDPGWRNGCTALGRNHRQRESGHFRTSGICTPSDAGRA